MKRPSPRRANDLPSQILAANPALLLGAAFEIGMLLGRRTSRTAVGKKVRQSVHGAVDQAVQLVPDRVADLVPQLAPPKPAAKPRARKRTAAKKSD